MCLGSVATIVVPRAFKSAFKTYGRLGLFAHFVRGGGSSRDPGKPWGAPEAKGARL